jgi:hypothetical protein
MTIPEPRQTLAAVTTPKLAGTNLSKPPSDRQFSIKRTKSEVGYVYWVLEGYGRHKCFVLCDSWEEAMEQAKARLDSEKEDSQEYIFADGL